MKKLSLVLALSLGLFQTSFAAEESDEELLEMNEASDEVSTKKSSNSPSKEAIETSEVPDTNSSSKKAIEVANIPFPANGLHFFGHRIVDNEKGIVCYTVVKAGTAPQLWCSK